nr:iron chelate uptake ABC transporter family permease subunit [Pseudomonas sp.]
APVLLMHRALTLISIGDGIASGGGLHPGHARLFLLLIVALLCGLITSLVGPIAFLGLLAPHMARLFGAQRVLPQLFIASLLGSVLLLMADWLGRTVLFPIQVPVGLLASILCGAYFIMLLVRPRLSRGTS